LWAGLEIAYQNENVPEELYRGEGGEMKKFKRNIVDPRPPNEDEMRASMQCYSSPDKFAMVVHNDDLPGPALIELDKEMATALVESLLEFMRG
jgi:hypothetical protein